MELLLWRHAEAEDSTPDLSRRLTAHGHQQARRMAAWLQRHAPAHLRIIVSPATRCQETAQALGLPFETDKRLGTSGNVDTLLDAAGWPGDIKHASHAVLIVGHQPTLGATAARVLTGADAGWSVKKAAVWWISGRLRHNEIVARLHAVIPPELG